MIFRINNIFVIYKLGVDNGTKISKTIYRQSFRNFL